MISGIHALIFSHDADATRAFFRDVLGLRFVDPGGGWLIFALPPTELGVHPADGEYRHELYLMCDDIQSAVRQLRDKGVEFTRSIADEDFGLVTSLRLPGGGELALYQPKHPTAIGTRPSP